MAKVPNMQRWNGRSVLLHTALLREPTMPKTALRLGFTVLLLAVSRNTLADPVTINVVSTHFNVNLSGYANSGPPGGSGGSAAFSASSSDPIASTTIQPDSLNPYVYAQGAASFFDVSEATGGHLGHMTAFAETEIDFTSNGLGSLALDLNRDGNINFAFGSFTLFDLTTGQLLWTYAFGTQGCQGSSHCGFAFDQLFNPDHVYRLTETAQSNAAGDSESVHLHLTGLAVPEPATVLTLAAGLIGIVVMKRRRRRSVC